MHGDRLPRSAAGGADLCDAGECDVQRRRELRILAAGQTEDLIEAEAQASEVQGGSAPKGRSLCTAQSEESEQGEEIGQDDPRGCKVSVLRSKTGGRRGLALTVVLLAVCTSAVFSASASARAGWGLDAFTDPGYLRPGGQGVIVVRVLNDGATDSEGQVTVTDTLPPGVTATVAHADERGTHEVGPDEARPNETVEEYQEAWICSGDGPGGAVAGAHVVSCVNNPLVMPKITGGGGTPTGPSVTGPNSEEFDPEYADEQLAIGVRAPAGADGALAEPNRVTVTGGGALTPTSIVEPITVKSGPIPFGFTSVNAWFTNADGTIDTQAGSHPYEATFILDYNTEYIKEGFPHHHTAGGEARNVTFVLPPGLIGDPYAVPRCPFQQFTGGHGCPIASQIGIISAESEGETLFEGNTEGGGHDDTPVFDVVPPAGEPAEFGFYFLGIPTFIGTEVQSGSNYAIRSQVNNIPQRDVPGSVLTLWGEPGNPSHDRWRIGKRAANYPEKAFLTLPTSCEGPQAFSVSVNSWEHPNEYIHASFPTHDANGQPAGFTGCESLGFGQSLSAEPDTSNADTPGGVTAGIRSQLGGIEGPENLANTYLKHVTFKLPPGVAINPGQGAGLEACPLADSGIGVEGNSEEPFKGEPHCPNASKVGTDEAELPVLGHPLTGNIYVLPSEPPHLLLLFALSGEGVSAKLIGRVDMEEGTGQLTAHFGEPITQQEEAEDPELKELKGHMVLPQAPVSNFRASFSGGPQAALASPTKCGTYTAEADATPWATPLVPDVLPAASFAIEHGVNGAPCPPTPLPYTPEMIAGSTTDQAGGYTDFSLLLRVPDDQQRTSGLQFKVPEGLAGMIAKIPLCHEQQANKGDCPAASQIGHTVVQSGPGQYPLVVPQPGQPPAPIYLTEGYKGAPFGLSVVVPIHVGPFTLKTQIVRAKVEINPITTEITITTDPLPQYVAGIPTDLRTIDTVVDHPEFMFNPTGCEAKAFAGTAYGNEGAQAPIASHFQMGSCRALKFSPNFKVFASGKISRQNGVSFGAKVVYPVGNLGANQATSQSNIKYVKVELPKQLPSRLPTLQKACTAAQFDANPAGCPTASVVGHAKALTPVLPVPLEGPAYFVSNGGEAFPNLIVVLQGYGITVHLVADTFISKAGITSSTFKQVPDVPVESFELNLPAGPYSALTGLGNLCKEKLTMPTDFIGQNGAELRQDTKVEVQGCGRVKKASHRKAKHRGKSKQKPRHTRRAIQKGR